MDIRYISIGFYVFLFLAGVVDVILVLGMLSGCSVDRQVGTESCLSAHGYGTEPVEIPQDSPEPAQEAEEELEPEEEQEQEEDSERLLSADAREIREMALKFAGAYFIGDSDALKAFLTVPYEWDVEVYTGTGAVRDITIKGLMDIGEEETGAVQTISLQFQDSEYEEMYIYLTIIFVKQEEGWKIQFYGLEG